MVNDTFFKGNSIVHKTDPRIKIVFLFIFASIAAVSKSESTLYFALGFSIFTVALSRIAFKSLVKRFLVVNSFLFVMWLIIPFTHPGQPIYHILQFTATKEGVEMVFIITLKANAIFLAAFTLLGSSNVFDIAHGLDHLHIPRKLVQLFFFTLRYSHLLNLEISRQRNAMKVRCFQPKTNMHTYRSYAYLMGMMLVRSLDRSQRVYQAMICRGFSGDFPAYHHPKFTLTDAAIFVFSACVIAIMGCLEWVR